MVSLRYQVVDAFTQSPFQGNPAAVIVFAPHDPRAASDAFLLDVAREFNFSETAYLTPLPSTTIPTYRLRWFTPEVVRQPRVLPCSSADPPCASQEFPLCGHATLASSHVLFNSLHTGADCLQFETMSGTLVARRVEDGRIELDFPADESVLEYVVGEEEVDKLVSGVREACSNVKELEQEMVGCARGKLGWIVELGAGVKLEELKIVSMVGLVRIL